MAGPSELPRRSNQCHMDSRRTCQRRFKVRTILIWFLLFSFHHQPSVSQKPMLEHLPAGKTRTSFLHMFAVEWPPRLDAVHPLQQCVKRQRPFGGAPGEARVPVWDISSRPFEKSVPKTPHNTAVSLVMVQLWHHSAVVQNTWEIISRNGHEDQTS